MSQRLGSVLPCIIDEDQSCAVPGRSIKDCIHMLRNSIDYVEQKNLTCAIISLDQSKAFDRFSHVYLRRVLEAFNFGPSFRRWVEILYTDIRSSVYVNGFISEAFPISRGVRQGCCLSPLLYVFMC